MATSIKNNSNTRIYNRNIPSAILEPQLRNIPESSRYQDMNEQLSAQSRHSQVIQNSKHHQFYHPQSTFNPGSSAPWNGYLSAVNTESVLRNQIHPYSKNDALEYVPSSRSDLYISTTQQSQSQNQYSYLNSSNHPNPVYHDSRIGYMLFNNSTRNQLKDTL